MSQNYIFESTKTCTTNNWFVAQLQLLYCGYILFTLLPTLCSLNYNNVFLYLVHDMFLKLVHNKFLLAYNVFLWYCFNWHMLCSLNL